MGMQEFFEELAAWKVAEKYPDDMKRVDYLSDKINAGDGTGAEKFEQASLDRKFQPELRRIVMHYRLNWSFMSREVKDRLRADLKAHQEGLKGTLGTHYKKEIENDKNV